MATADVIEPTLILVVDDEPQIRALLAHFLRRRFATVIEGATGTEGLRLFREHSPGVVISDLRMPEMGGLDLLKALRDADPEVEVILITGFGEMDDAVSALRHGASDFIAKPFDLVLVEHAVSRCVERRRFKAMARDYTRRLEGEVRRRTEELVAANRELEKLGRTREDFLTLIAHELRTPLAGMGLAELALEEIGSLSREEIADLLQGILQSFRRIHEFSERALLYSRLMSGADVGHHAPINFAALVADEVARLSPRIAEAGLSVQWNPAAELPIEGDRDHLRFLVRALLDNAVKHNQPGGSLDVRLLATDGGGFVFTVTDTGLGLAADAVESIFEPFAAPDVLHRRSGTALSLAIGRLISQRHAMQLACASAGPGHGATFTLTFPGHSPRQRHARVNPPAHLPPRSRI
ncbi:MAG: hybrid sensor histidine kinase/response regulator [Candidatus Eisenbacteria bacterium]|jgi:signal transduction histidine kinase|nr:hybrid sensor histidine kinase/response regulator [Candidatus Eisenbacteria bacterium]